MKRTGKNKRNVKRIVINIILGLIIVISTFLYFRPPAYWLAKNLQDKGNNDIKIESPYKLSNKDDNKSTDAFNDGDYYEFTTQNLIDAQDADVGQSGKLIIPSAGISLPILQGIGGYNMFYGAGEQLSRQEVAPGGKGNYILASHYTDVPGLLFTELASTKVGGIVQVADYENVYTYRVTNLQKINVNDTAVLQQPEDKDAHNITIYTCTYYNSPWRYVVTGKLESTIKFNKLNKDTKTAFQGWINKVNASQGI